MRKAEVSKTLNEIADFAIPKGSDYNGSLDHWQMLCIANDKLFQVARRLRELDSDFMSEEVLTAH